MTRRMTNALQALMKLSDEDRAHCRRILTGEADNDLIRRGDMLNVLRDLRTNPCKPSEYQRALSDVTRALYRLSGPSA